MVTLNRVPTVALDTSAWLRKVFNEGLEEELRQTVIRLGATLAIPSEVFSEFLDQQDADRAWDRCSRAMAFAETVPTRWVVSWAELIKREQRKGGVPFSRKRHGPKRGPIETVPTREAGEIAAIRAAVSNREQFSEHWDELYSNAHYNLAKDETHATDKEARAIAASLDPAEMNVTAATFTNHVNGYPGTLANGVPLSSLIPNAHDRATIMRKPAYFKATLAWALATDLTTVGIGQAEFAPKTIAPLKSHDRNAMTDAKVVGVAAYLEYLVTEDGEQAFKANTAARVFGLPLVAQNVEMFLQSVNARQT